MIKRISILFFAITCLFFINACTLKASYHLLDNFMAWQVGKYVSLKGEQKKEAKQLFDDFHDWHRHTQLPLYANYLESLKSKMLEGPVTAEFLHAESDKLQSLLDISLEQILPGATSVVASFSDKQIKEIQENLAKEREEYRADYVDAKREKIKKRRIRDVTNIVGGFFGRFTDEQKQRLSDWENQLSHHEELMLKQQSLWEDDFVAAMAHQNNLSRLQSELRSLMLYRTDNWDPELQARLDINQKLTFIMFADLFNSQTEKQKGKLEKKFNRYINDLRELAIAKKIKKN